MGDASILGEGAGALIYCGCLMGWDGESVDLIYRPVDGVEGVEGVECMEAVEAVVVVPWLPRWQWHILLQCTYYCSVHTYYCSAHTTAVATALDG